MKKVVSIIMALTVCLLSFSSAYAVSLEAGIEELKNNFIAGEGPAVGEYTLDYRYFSPVKNKESKKYPLVIWLHGMGDGAEEGLQVTKSNIAFWSSDEFQSRFGKAGGAFIFAPRSLEEKGLFWTNSLIEPLKAAIDDFIAKNKKNIDLSRIYIGGYSMGGKMTFKMAIAYPEMFAAAFPICPAWAPNKQQLSLIADMPVWITSSTLDPLVNYYLAVSPTWDTLLSVSNVKEDCRFSTLKMVYYHDGKKTGSNHHAWFAVNYDMFSLENGDYPKMSTVNGNGEEVKLTYPKGMIDWLSGHTSDYKGQASVGMGNINPDDSDRMVAADGIFDFISLLFKAIGRIVGI